MSLSKITIPIEGMTCDGCRKRVDKLLTRVPGVAQVAVSLEDRRAVVEAPREAVDALREVVQAAGFKPGEAVVG